MARKTSRVYVTGLDKGLDTNIASSIIDEKSAVDLLNIVWNEGKVITKRSGFEPVANFTQPKALGRLILSTKREIIVIDGTKFMRSGEDLIFSELTGQTFNTNATEYNIIQIKNKAYIWNSMDSGTAYNGTALTRPGTMPKASFSVYYKGYHIASGVPGQESRIYMSTIANTDDFTNDPSATTDGPDPDNATEVPGATVFTGSPPDVAQFIDISPSDGDRVTGLVEYQDYLIITKQNSIWSMTIDIATNKPVIQLVTRAIGCVGFKTIQAVDNDVYMLSDQGPISLGNEREYAGALRTNLLGKKMKTFIDNINPEGWDGAAACYYDKMYILSVPYGREITNSRTLSLDTRYGGWSVWDNMNSYVWLNFMKANNTRKLYFFREGDTRLHEYMPGHYYDDGGAIKAFWRSKAIDAGVLDVTKRWTYFTLFMRNVNQSATVQISTELEDLERMNIFESSIGEGLGFVQMGVQTWLGPVSENDPANTVTAQSFDEAWRTNPNLEARTLTFEVGNEKPGETFYFSGFSAEFISLKAYYHDQSKTF